MINLDNEKEIKSKDKSAIVESIKLLPKQIEQAWYEIKKLDTPAACYIAKNIVISGMGGSALGGRIIDSLIPDRARVPIEVFTEFNLPNYVNKDTLVIISSYSGNTEETISCAYEAIKKEAKVFVITTGGKLKNLAEKENLTGYIFEPKYNTSNQPRMALGYSITAIISILAKCEFIHVSDQEIDDVLKSLNKFITEFDIDITEDKNIAKSLAKKLKDKIPILVASEHLIGSAHAFKNQLNENAKTFSVLFDIPELNHHLMEGLRNPAVAKQYFQFLFFESNVYSSFVKKRYPITKEVIEKNEVSYIVYNTQGSTKLNQIFELLALGSYVSFYLAYIYGVDPAVIPWVDYFKKRLS